MSRKSGIREVKKTYLVLGDGRTEQYYLKHLKALRGYKYSIRPSLFSSITIETAENIIDSHLSGGCDQIIYFTDYDTIVNQNKINDFQRLKKKYAYNSQVFICETMPCIEFWFLMHYFKTTQEFINASEVIKLLLKYMKNYCKEEAFLKNLNWVQSICKDNKLETAIKNSTLILKQQCSGDKGKHFPYSKVHLALEYFESQVK